MSSGTPKVTVRLAATSDGPELLQLLRANREFLAPWEPERDDAYFTEPVQRDLLRAALDHEATVPHVIEVDGRIAGRITLNNVVWGPFQSANVGYWVGRDHNGRGVASAALAELIRIAFDELGLHRLAAGTLVHNIRSQRVLAHNGFALYGLAPKYLKIAGSWQDHALFQRIKEG